MFLRQTAGHRTTEESKANLFWGDETVHEFQTFQVLSWTKRHGKQVEFAVCNARQQA